MSKKSYSPGATQQPFGHPLCIHNLGQTAYFPDQFLSDTGCAQLLSCSKATWWRRVADGTMPNPIRIGSITRWRLSEVLAAIEALQHQTNGGPAS